MNGGVNVTEMIVTQNEVKQEVTKMNRFGIGLILGSELNRIFSIQISPQYLQKGGGLILDENDLQYDIFSSFFQTDLDIKATLPINPGPYLIAGPYFGYNLYTRGIVESQGHTIDIDFLDTFREIDYGINLGAGIQIAIGKGHLFIEGRYLLGLNDLNVGGPIDFSVDGMVIASEEIPESDTFMNRGIRVSLGSVFPLHQ